MEDSRQGFYTDTGMRHGRFHIRILHRHTNKTWNIPHRDSTQTHESDMEDSTHGFYTDTLIRHGRFHTGILHRDTNQTWKIPDRDSTQTQE